MYWKVETDHSLTITRNLEEASAFHVIPCADSDDDDTNDFYIGWKGETLKSVMDKEEAVGPDNMPKIMQFLDVSSCKRRPGPLKFESSLNTNNARLYIYDRLISSYFGGYFETPAPDLEPWTKKKQVFFTSRKSFVTVKWPQNTEQAARRRRV